MNAKHQAEQLRNKHGISRAINMTQRYQEFWRKVEEEIKKIEV